MKRISLIIVMFISSGALNACIGLPSLGNLFYPVEDNKPAYARGGHDDTSAKGRAPLDVPPELRKDIEVPMPDKIATEAAQGDVGIPANVKKLIAGKAVSLDAHVYKRTPAQVFSAVVDAMTSLNMPVSSVDSPSGTITTEWVRKDSSNANAYLASAMDMFGGGPTHTRYRFVVRVLRMKDGGTQLQIRTLGQQFTNRHWMDKPIKRKVANELFSAVEERLAQLVPLTPNNEGASLPTKNP